LIFNIVTLSFDWLAFVVKLVWRAAEYCDRVPNWYVLYAVWNRGFWKRVVCCGAKGQSAKRAYARGRKRIQTRSQVNLRGGHRQADTSA